MFHFRQGIKNIPEICTQLGVKNVIIAPGSRNAPLIFAFTAQHNINCLSITDERSAAYFALGMSQQSGEPIALVCTSGTAVLNFAPAIAEAYYQNIPLIVFTADRPSEMIDQADGQTLRQNNIFSNYIKAAFELPVDTEKKQDLLFSDRLVSQAIDTALSYPKGPVQINVPLREPIYVPIPDTHSEPKIIRSQPQNTALSPESLEKLRTNWTSYKRKMIVVGVFAQNEPLNTLLQQLAKEPDLVVVAENLSNIAGENIITQAESFFSRINSLENSHEFAPDLLITIGHSVICKQLKLFLRSHQASVQWQIESTLPYVDTYQSLTSILPGSATDILSKMPTGVTKSDYTLKCRAEIEQIRILHKEFVSKTELSDMTVMAEILRQTRPDTVLQLANSTSVRWMQLFETRADLTYYCNRGTSGIDGSLSTAAGFAYNSARDVLFVTGDVSFIYDSNGLWNNYTGKNLKIIVLNNNGGNIFRFIGDKELMKNNLHFFTTPHQVQIKLLVEAYGVDYLNCNEAADLSGKIEQLLNSANATVLEVFTDSELNTENYKKYFQHIKE